MYSVLDKDTIENKIVPHLPEQKRGFPPRVPLSEIISAILYKLKIGIQWALLPVKHCLVQLFCVGNQFIITLESSVSVVFGRIVGQN